MREPALKNQPHIAPPWQPLENEAERRAFEAIQARFGQTFDTLINELNTPKTVLIVPSLSLDQQIMSKITGVHHYEERMLCLLFLLRMPRTKLIYLTSTPIHETIIDYYLHLLPGVPTRHARSRLRLLSCYDQSPQPLTQKILDRPRLMDHIRAEIPDKSVAHMSCFNVTGLEQRLALALDLPIFGCDPALLYWGTKSGSRKVFREAGIKMPIGHEDLSDKTDIAKAITDIKQQQPGLEKAVVKINEGFSGEGNAVLDLQAAPQGAGLGPWVEQELPNLAFETKDMTWDFYQEKFRNMGGIVEAFIPGKVKTSPSAQFRIDPHNRLIRISTHDQVLEGENAQIFTGARFPAAKDYRLDIQAEGEKAANILLEKGVLGRFGVDFISVKQEGEWSHYAIEINLRKGGTTHPFLMLQFLTDGHYDPATGQYLTMAGKPRCYYASDNLESPRLRGLTPDDLIDISVMNGLHFHAATGEGVAFHLMGALSEFGKLGIVCIGETHERADELYQQTVSVLKKEGER